MPSATSSPARSSGGSSPARAADPILRNALRYTISAREYATLHKYVLSRSRVLRRNTPSVETVARIVNGPPLDSASTTLSSVVRKAPSKAEAGKGGSKANEATTAESADAAAKNDADAALAPRVSDYNARAVRHSLRVFMATGLALKLWAVIAKGLLGYKPDPATLGAKKEPLYKSPTLRLSLSLSTILLMYRLLFRFFTRLRLQLLDASAEPFRRRNPRTAGTLTSPLAPAVGASLAGLALGIYPAAQLRVSVAIYALFRALEFSWNMAEQSGAVWGWEKKELAGRGSSVLTKRSRPDWWGSWMLMPFAFGQLLHAAVFDRDCFPAAVGDFIFGKSGAYIQKRPAECPRSIQWPGTYEIVDSLATMAKLNWPPFVSPSLFPDKQATLPPTLTAIAPITNRAHPLLTSLSCATLHPQDPSCARTYLTFWLRAFPPTARFFLIIYSVLALPRFSKLYHSPLAVLQTLISSALRTSTFMTGAISTAWASICFLQAWLPRSALATQRFFLGGFAAGFWAWIERRRGRGMFIYSARASVDSLWKVGVKRRWWRAMKGGDVWVFVLAVMLTGVVYERDATAVREGPWRKGISWIRGEGWRDWALDDLEGESDDEKEDDGGERAALMRKDR